jgi:allantoin racemase
MAPSARRRRIGLIGTITDPSGRGVAPELSPLVEAGTELVAFPSRVRAFPSSALERAMQEIGHAEAAFAATEQGCDAVVIDSVGDYGLAAMRASLPVPAFGAGESGMAEAAAGGRCFAIVSVWPVSMNFILDGRLRDYGCVDRCRRIYNIGQQQQMEDVDGVAVHLERVRGAAPDIVAALVRAIADAASEGAEAVMLGCTCMSAMAALLQDGAPVPVINPLAAAVRASLEARSIAPPTLGAGRREMLGKMVDAVAGEPAEACLACAIGADHDVPIRSNSPDMLAAHQALE